MIGSLFIVSAPSGAGKTTLCKMAVDFFPGLRHSVSYTTRPARPGETNGKDYWFVDDAAFDRMLASGEFLEYAGVFGKRYGTSKKDLEALLKAGADVLLEIDVQGALNVRKRLNKGAYIFILPPSIKACEDRLRTRSSDPPEEIQRRLRIAVDEIRHAVDYDYVIVNDVLEAAFERLKAVMIAEKARTVNMSGAVKRLLADVG